MKKSEEIRFARSGVEHLKGSARGLGPNSPSTPKSKKERPASKGRVHKGRTRS